MEIVVGQVETEGDQDFKARKHAKSVGVGGFEQ